MVDNASIPRVKPENIQKGNKIIGDIAQKYPGKILALAGIDPRHLEAPDGITFTQDEVDAILGENAARLWGMKP